MATKKEIAAEAKAALAKKMSSGMTNGEKAKMQGEIQQLKFDVAVLNKRITSIVEAISKCKKVKGL